MMKVGTGESAERLSIRPAYWFAICEMASLPLLPPFLFAFRKVDYVNARLGAVTILDYIPNVALPTRQKRKLI